MNRRLVLGKSVLSIGLVAVFLLPGLSHANDACDYDKIRGASVYTKDEDLLAGAVAMNCPELMATALKKEKEDDLFRATQGFMQNTLEYLSIALQGMKHTDQDDPDAQLVNAKVKIIGQFKEFLTSKCSKETDDTDACKALKTFKSYGGKLQEKFAALQAEEEAEAKDAAFNSSPEGMIQKTCACDKFIKVNRETIDRQKEIGKVSGTVNIVTLNSAGSQMVDLQRMKKEIAKKYKAATKKDLKNYKCRNVENLQNPLLEGSGIRE